MQLLMWRLLQRKTKFIVIWTIIFVPFFLFFSLIQLLDLRIFMFSVIIFPLQAIAYLVLTYAIGFLITLIFYDVKWIIRVLLGFMSLCSIFIISYFSMYLLFFNLKITEIKVNDALRLLYWKQMYS